MEGEVPLGVALPRRSGVGRDEGLEEHERHRLGGVEAGEVQGQVPPALGVDPRPRLHGVRSQVYQRAG